MKIQYASDLHLEFADNSRWLKENPLVIAGEILVLAGDIGYIGDDNYSKHPFWNWASDNYKQVIVVPGNHEFYKMFDLATLHNGWIFNIRPNVDCYYNAVIPLADGVDLIATTLWSHISVENAYPIESCISDFKRIRYKDNPLDWERFNEEHDFCVRFLKTSVEHSQAKTILVASHHVPSFALMADEYKGSNVNEAFTVELGDYIAQSPVKYWIYGHSHRNIDRTIGNTKCVSNQLGYVFAGEHQSFEPNKHIVL